MTNTNNTGFSLLLEINDDTSDGCQGARLTLRVECPMTDLAWLSASSQGVSGVPSALRVQVLTEWQKQYANLCDLEDGDTDTWLSASDDSFTINGPTLFDALDKALSDGTGAEVRSARSAGLLTAAAPARWVFEVSYPLQNA